LRKHNPVYRRVLTLAVPMMIQNGITNAVGLVDHVMVGSLGTEAMTAVSIVGQLIFVFNLAIFGGLSGPGIFGAQFCGQKNYEGIRQSFRMKICIALVVLIAGLTAFLTLGPQMIRLYLHGESTEVDPELTIRYGMRYLRIMLFGLLPFSVTQIYAGTLRENGESIKPMAAGIISVCADILFNYLLIYGHFGFPKMGVAGAAAATVIARCLETGVLLIWVSCTRSRYPFLQGAWKTLRIPKDTAVPMLRKTMPIFCNEFLWSGGMAAMTQCYSLRGLHIVSGLNISTALCNLLNVVFVALGSAVGILIGQTLGAGKYEQAKKDSFTLTVFTGVICACLSVLLIALAGSFPQLYDTTANVRNLAKRFIIVTAVFFPVQGILNSLYFTLRSGGKTLVTFLFDSVYTWVFTVPLALLLCKKTSLPVVTVYAAVQSADIIKIIIGSVLIRQGLWISTLESSDENTQRKTE